LRRESDLDLSNSLRLCRIGRWTNVLYARVMCGTPRTVRRNQGDAESAGALVRDRQSACGR